MTLTEGEKYRTNMKKIRSLLPKIYTKKINNPFQVTKKTKKKKIGTKNATWVFVKTLKTYSRPE